jgi:hypothetical protein
MSSDLDIVEPSGRRHRFQRKRLRDHLALAAALAAGIALWAVILWPAIEMLLR